MAGEHPARTSVSNEADAPARSHSSRRAALSGYLGNTIEFYDFLLYGTASAIVFNRLFFGNLSPLLATVASFATFAAGYVARPIGGIVFGHFGDRVGRKSALLVTMTMMGLCSGLIGVLPTYASIGVAAPLLLLLLRLIQGLAVGGEWGGAALMTAEHAHPERRGLIGSMAQIGLPSGSILATGAFALVGLLPDDQFLSWGWRLPFLASFVLLAVGLYVRAKVDESPVFREAERRSAEDEQRPADSATPRVPLLELIRKYPSRVLRGALIGITPLAISSLFGAFMVSYAVQIGYSRSTVLLSIVIGSATAVAAMPMCAFLSDRIGRKPVILAGALGSAVLAYPAFWMVDTGSTGWLITSQVLYLGILSGAMNGPMVALLSEMFGTAVRYTGLSVSYQAATLLGGGFTPLIAASLVAAAGGVATGVTGIPLYLAALSLVTAVAVWFVADGRGRNLIDDPI